MDARVRPLQVALVVAIVLTCVTACTTREVRTETATVTTTASVAPPPATQTVTVTATTTASAPKPVRSTVHKPQGTITIGFQNDDSGRPNCSDTTVFVHNKSDTAVLSISVVFRPSWSADVDGQVKSQRMPLSAPITHPVGVAPFESRSVTFSVCAPPPSFSIKGASFATVDAVPVSFTWKWAQ